MVQKSNFLVANRIELSANASSAQIRYSLIDAKEFGIWGDNDQIIAMI